MLKEAYDDWERYKRDKEANSALYKLQFKWFLIYEYRRIKGNSSEVVPSANLKVGDVIEVHANQRIPADLLLLYTP